MTKDEALKLALEALEGCHTSDKPMHQFFNKPKTDKAITAIKAALAQDELCSSQEPVAWEVGVVNGVVTRRLASPASPPKRPWVGLTDEETKEQIKRSDLLDMFEHIGWYSAPRKGFDKNAILLIQAIEAKLKELNT